MRKVNLLMPVLITMVLQACDEPAPRAAEQAAGDLISSELLFEYSATQITQLFQSIGLPSPATQIPEIRSYRITYLSPDLSNVLRELSGALIVPSDGVTHPLLSIQHGTVSGRWEVASVDPLNSAAGISGLLSASQGYVTLVPDYAGFGISHEMHPYLHREALARSVIDLLRAGRSYCQEQRIPLDERLFLTGYSEGGYATLAAQKMIESELSEEFCLTAVAPMAGPYDLYATAQHVLAADAYNWPAYIGFMFVAYDEIYAFGDLGEIINPPFDQSLPGYFDGSRSFIDINALLPVTISQLIQAEFRTEFLAGTELLHSSAFRENSLLDWTPEAPLRFIHGTEDTTVPFAIATATVDALIANGATAVELESIMGANHETAGVPAVLSMLSWFATFSWIGSQS